MSLLIQHTRLYFYIYIFVKASGKASIEVNSLFLAALLMYHQAEPHPITLGPTSQPVSDSTSPTSQHVWATFQSISRLYFVLLYSLALVTMMRQIAGAAHSTRAAPDEGYNTMLHSNNQVFCDRCNCLITCNKAQFFEGPFNRAALGHSSELIW